MAGLLSQNAPQPHVVIRILTVKIDCLLALRRSLRPLLKGKSNPAKQVLRLGGAIASGGQRRQKRDRGVGLASLQILIRLGECSSRDLRAHRIHGSQRQGR